MDSGEYNILKIELDNYSGPLEVLLDLAKLQKVDFPLNTSPKMMNF